MHGDAARSVDWMLFAAQAITWLESEHSEWISDPNAHFEDMVNYLKEKYYKNNRIDDRGYSVEALVQEIISYYASFQQRLPPSLPPTINVKST